MRESEATHPEHEQEQAYIDHAYERLETIREQANQRAARLMRESTTMYGQQFDRDVAVRVALHRASSLDIGDESIIFGRTDSLTEERYHIGRRAVFGEHHEPMVIDWRVPAAEPYYRATGHQPLGLALRRHFLCEGRKLLTIEDEHFGDGTDLGLAGTGALLAALERPRVGTMRDIAATIRGEQDRIIRAPLEGIIAVQGGPGTGKTAVALHRAAFLLFTHRRKLGRQGILVIGPNRRFLRYIERVLPALGESGARLATLEDLVDGVTVRSAEAAPVARLKGDARMAAVVVRAIKDRRRPPNRGVTVFFNGYELALSAGEISQIAATARRSRRSHNARHTMVRSAVAAGLYQRYVSAVRDRFGSAATTEAMSRELGEDMLESNEAVTALLDEIWPLLTPKRLIEDLLSSHTRLRAAGRGILSAQETEMLYREDGSAWTVADLPLIEEAFTILGAPLRNRRQDDEDEDDDDEIETYGHVVADEVQDLSPMALRMLGRRSRHGSMTVVGDLAQSIGATPPGSWDEILVHLPGRDAQRVEELTINYRTPGSIMDLAARLLAETSPGLVPPISVRESGEPVGLIPGAVDPSIRRIAGEHREAGIGTMAVIAPPSLLATARVAAGGSDEPGSTIVALSVQDAKGLEFDEVVIVEPARIADESPQGLRALYVALTRATRRVRIVHAQPLPPSLVAP